MACLLEKKFNEIKGLEVPGCEDPPGRRENPPGLEDTLSPSPDLAELKPEIDNL